MSVQPAHPQSGRLYLSISLLELKFSRSATSIEFDLLLSDGLWSLFSLFRDVTVLQFTVFLTYFMFCEILNFGEFRINWQEEKSLKMGMLSMMNNSTYSRHLADVSQGLAFPQSIPNPVVSHCHAKRKKKNILLVPGEAQLFLGITGLVMLALQLEGNCKVSVLRKDFKSLSLCLQLVQDHNEVVFRRRWPSTDFVFSSTFFPEFLVPITTATLWMIGSGIIALCSSCCTLNSFRRIAEGFSSAHTIPCKYRRFSLVCLCVYEIIVLIGILLSFTAAGHSFYIMLTRSRQLIASGSLHSTEMETSDSILSSLLGLILCFVQSFVLYTIQKAVARLSRSQKVLQRRHPQNALNENISHNDDPVISSSPASADISTEFDQESQHVQDNLPSIVPHVLHSPPPPHYSAIGGPDENPQPDFPGRLCSRRTSTGILTEFEEETIRESGDLPPRYADIDGPRERPPSPVTSSRDTALFIPSLPPSYSEIIGFPTGNDWAQR
jgi:hypothetical protein